MSATVSTNHLPTVVNVACPLCFRLQIHATVQGRYACLSPTCGCSFFREIGQRTYERALKRNVKSSAAVETA
jgi:hypothetical protein